MIPYLNPVSIVNSYSYQVFVKVGEGGMYARTRQRNIRRTEPLTKSLIELASKAEATQNGYLRRLEQLWLEVHPTLPSRGSALTQKFKRI